MGQGAIQDREKVEGVRLQGRGTGIQDHRMGRNRYKYRFRFTGYRSGLKDNTKASV